jgi:hypothetical protein
MTSLVSEEPEIPNHLMCPITHCLMKYPVTASDGQTYEKEAIEKWMKGNNLSPITREPITSINPNFTIKSLCEDFKKNKEFFVNEELKETSENLKKKKAEIKNSLGIFASKAAKELFEENNLSPEVLKNPSGTKGGFTLKDVKEILPINFYTMTINGNVYRTINTTTMTTTTITSNSIPDENGNINCTNCVGCYNCIGCTNCRNCDGCTGCTDCKYCDGCTGCANCNRCGNCTGCANCERCHGCTGCQDCDSCTDSTGCVDCERCTKCTDCRKCYNCTKCKDCRNLWDGISCESCKGGKNCTDCKNCDKCSSCKECKDCTNCFMCYRCVGVKRGDNLRNRINLKRE